MKIVHFDGGLGNQMASYANYVIARNCHPNEDIYRECFAYDISESGNAVCQWNGYELEKIFDIKIPKIDEIISEEDKKKIIDSMIKSKFWENGWHVRSAVVDALHEIGFDFKVVGHTDNDNVTRKSLMYRIKVAVRNFLNKPSKNRISYFLKSKIYNLAKNKNTNVCDLYEKRDGNWFYTLRFDVMKEKELMSKIESDLKKDFTFKPITDERNKEMLEIIENTNSVSIHARRSDFLQYNSDCYKFGYFKKSVKFIKKKVENPVFFIFSEESDWCKENLDVFGLDIKKDKIYFVDWNASGESYRDMQLMAKCKHNIITKSSFGWWALFLNDNPNKITISQISGYYTKYHF